MFITITECDASGKQWVHNSRTNDSTNAIDRAVKKNFGKNARFFADIALANSGIYGEIIKSTSNANEYKCIASRVKINVD